MRNYYLSEAATDDLDNVWIYGLNQWGLQQADSYHPDIGMNRKALGDFYQSYLIGSHIVFLKAYKENIKIIRVLHQPMDAVLNFGR